MNAQLEEAYVAGVMAKLAEYGITENDIPGLSKEAVRGDQVLKLIQRANKAMSKYRLDIPGQAEKIRRMSSHPVNRVAWIAERLNAKNLKPSSNISIGNFVTKMQPHQQRYSDYIADAASILKRSLPKLEAVSSTVKPSVLAETVQRAGLEGTKNTPFINKVLAVLTNGVKL